MKSTEIAALTPYLRDELIELLRFYNSDSSSDWFQGLQLVAAWQLRCSSTLPTFLYLTEMILKARLNHAISEAYSSVSQWYNDENVKHFDSLVIIRFVNFIYEHAQARHKRLITVKDAAAEFNIPEWIVELRHAATHSPVMCDSWLCRAAITFLSDWLKENFWKKYTLTDSFMDSRRSQKSTLSQKNINKLFKLYTRYFEPDVDASCGSKTGKMSIIIRKITHAVKSSADAFLSALLDRLILPERKMKYSKWDICDKCPPLSLQQYWRHLFLVVKRSGKMGQLLKILCDKYVRSIFEHEQVQTKAWIFHLLDGHWLDKVSDDSCLQVVLRNFVRAYPIEREDGQLLKHVLQRISNCQSSELNDKLASFTSLFDPESLNIVENMVDELIKSSLFEASIDGYDLLTRNNDSNAGGPWHLDFENAEIWDTLPFGTILGENGSYSSLKLCKFSAPQQDESCDDKDDATDK